MPSRLGIRRARHRRTPKSFPLPKNFPTRGCLTGATMSISRLVAPPASTLEKLVNKAKSSEQVAANRADLRAAPGAHARAARELFRQIERRRAKARRTIRRSIRAGLCHALGEALPGERGDLRRDHGLSQLDPGNDSTQPDPILFRADHRRARRRLELRAGRETWRCPTGRSSR